MTNEEKILSRAKEIWKLANDGLDKEAFDNAFKVLLDVILKVEKKNDDRFSSTLEDLKTKISNLLKGEDKEFENLKNIFIKEIDKALREQENGMNFLRDKVRRLKDGEDGKDGKDGKDGSPDTSDEIRNKLELLQGDERLNRTAIKGLEELKEEIEELKSRPTRMGEGGFSAIAMQQHILPWTEMTGTVDGSNTTFTLGQAPNPTNSLEVMVGGSPLFLTDDFTYTASTRTVEFLTAPPSGAKVRYKCLL